MEKRKTAKSKAAKTTAMTLHLDAELLAAVDKLATAEFEGRRQQAVRRLIRLGLETSNSKETL